MSRQSLHLAKQLSALDCTLQAQSQIWTSARLFKVGHFESSRAFRASASLAEKNPTRRTVILSGGGAGAFTTLASPLAASDNMQDGKEISTDELKKAVKSIVPAMTGEKSKGQAGMIGVIGGCREYTGAPYFSAISVLKIGADLSHVFCTEGAATVIKSYSPELIVHPYLPDSHDLANGESGQERVREAVAQIQHWADRFDVMVIGPGLGRDELVHETVKQVITYLREKQKPMVIDADGLYITTKNLDLVKGYKNVILTPNKNEFQRLADQLKVPLEGGGAPGDPLLDITKRLEGPIIVRKGAEDKVCNGFVTISNGEGGSKRRAGGQGDVLSGSLAVMAAWALESEAESQGTAGFPYELSPLMIASYGGSLVARFAQQAAFEKHRRSMLAEDVINELGATVDRLFS